MLPSLSVRKPYTVLVAVVLIITTGIVSFIGMKTDLLPNIELPYVIVSTTLPGASPEKVEQTVTRPLEAVLGRTGGLKEISSISNENSSLVILEFIQGINMDRVMIELSGYIDQAISRLDAAASRPTMLKISPDLLPVMVASVDLAGSDLTELTRLTEDVLLNRLERIDGVASVSASGLLEQTILIQLDAEKIRDFEDKWHEQLTAELAQKEEELNDARKTLLESREQLTDQMPEQKEKIASAGVTLLSTIANLEALLSEEQKLAAEAEALNQQKSMLEEAADFESLLGEYFPDGLDSISPDSVDDLIDNWPDLAGLEPSFDPDLTLSQLEQLRDLSSAELSEKVMAVVGAAAQQQLLEIELQQVKARQMMVSAMAPQLKSGLAQARAGLAELESGKIDLAVETSKAQIQIENGLNALEQAQSELNKGRDEALKQINVENMLSRDLLAGILTAQNFQMPAGIITSENDSVVVKVGQQFVSQHQVEQTLLISNEYLGDIRLIDIASFTRRDNSEQAYARINGNRGIILTLQKQSIASTAEVTHQIKEEIVLLSQQIEGLRILPLLDQGEYIDLVIHSVLQNLLIGGFLAILILLLFLRDPRPTLVIAISIPVSLLFAITLMYFSKVTINIISLSGLALGVGMLVDNSIVAIDNIHRLRQTGMDANKAAVKGVQEIAGAISASTLTTVCVFLPIVFTQGLSRQLFSDMGLTIAYSLLASLVVALTVVPALSATALKRQSDVKHKLFDRITELYARSIAFCLRRKSVVLIPVVILLLLSIWGAVTMGTAFIPAMDSPQLSATFVTAPEQAADEIEDLIDQISADILALDAVEYVGTMTGGSFFAMGSGRAGAPGSNVSFYILLHDQRTQSNRDVEKEIIEIAARYPGEMSVTASNMDMGALGETGISIQVQGQDFDDMRLAARTVIDLLEETAGIDSLEHPLDDVARELRVIVDRDKAIQNELTSAQIFQILAQVLEDEKQAFTLSEGIDQIPVLLAEPQNKYLTPERLKDYQLSYTDRSGQPRSVRLGEVARLESFPTVQSIHRDNQTRTLTITASLLDTANIGLVSRDLEPQLKSLELPPGIRLQIGGENILIRDALGDVFLMIGLAVLFIYLIMVAQFQNLLSPFIVLFTMPLAFTGGLLALWLFNFELSIIASLGFLILAGIVVNNGIVYVSTVIQLIDEGQSQTEALILTGRLRLRPILMTAFTTILAMTTMALGVGQGSELTQPLAIVTIGGLFYATLLTLLVVPLLFDLFVKDKTKAATAITD